MATSKYPARPWDIGDLISLGVKQRTWHIRAVPIFILEQWIRGGREIGVANIVNTPDLADRLERADLLPGPLVRGGGPLFGSLTRIQQSSNLTDPYLLEYNHPKKNFTINLPHYEQLLQQYRQWYRQRHSEDYNKLFAQGAPEWGEELTRVETQDELWRALEPTRQLFLRLTEENQKLRTELDAIQALAQQLSFVHTSPDFTDTIYGQKINSLKDTIAEMLSRANHSIRISTRQIDMFDDDLINLKRSNPALEITVLSRGPEMVEGPRKRVVGQAFERMKNAQIKLPVDKVLLHSRMIVIDTNEVLVSSADLDYTHMEKEFNAGIWSNNPDVVSEAICYFDNLLKVAK